jgi:hypothetical protein
MLNGEMGRDSWRVLEKASHVFCLLFFLSFLFFFFFGGGTGG